MLGVPDATVFFSTILSAMARWQPIASMVTIAPSIANMSRSL